jgi:hypothetical protein
MRTETRIAFIPLLLTFAACTAIDTEGRQPLAGQGRDARSSHEHAHHQHQPREPAREHEHAQHQDRHQHGQHQHEPAQHGNHPHSAAVPGHSGGAEPQLWETDAPLREGMRNIRAALHGLEAGGVDGLTSSEVGDFSAGIDKQVAFMINNCKLQPQADAALHTIIADFVAAAASLKSNPTDTGPFASMHAALQRYARQFNDPEWRSEPPAVAQ